MSDLTGGPAGSGRASNGRGTAAPGPVPVPAPVPPAPVPQMRTPIDVLENRRQRERVKQQRAEASAEAPGKTTQEQQQQQQQTSAAERRFAALAQTVLPQQQPPQPYSRDSGYRSTGRSAGGQTPSEPPYTTPVLPAAYPTSRLAPQRDYDSVSAAQPSNIPQQSAATGLRPSGASSRPRGQSQGTPGRPTPQQPQPELSPKPQQTIPSSSFTQQGPSQPRQQPFAGTAQPSRGQATQPLSAQPPTMNPSSSTAQGAQQRQQPPYQPQSQQQQQQPQQPQQQQRPNVSSFPHAFERWETLSSHWEGLTSYWIRKLEQNTDGIRNDIAAQQMARQITDLSAAGANLFHAVVELQRLRASSERKFQRWFFEIRAQQAKEHEEKDKLRDELEEERANKTEFTRGEFDKRMAEMRRELQIAKDEARRAWEELGRREQEERERTSALRDGQPTWIGGVQVHPVQNAVSRGPSLQRPVAREETYHARPASGTVEGQREYSAFDPEDSSPTDTDPYTERPRQAGMRGGAQVAYPAQSITPTPGPRGQAEQAPLPTRRYNPNVPTVTSAPGQQPSAAAFYQQGGPSSQGGGIPSGRPVAEILRSTTGEGFSDEGGYALDEHGSPLLDNRGQPIPLRMSGESHRQAPRESLMSEVSAFSEDYQEQEPLRVGQVSSSTAAASTIAAPQSEELRQQQQRTAAVPEQPDYEGEGFGSGEGWEEMNPRHQHLTRLSDVLEEEEDQRSRASQGSQGMF